MTICPRCGASLPAGSAVCSQCGCQMTASGTGQAQPTAAPPAPPTGNPSGKRTAVISAIAAVVVIGLVVGGIFLIRNLTGGSGDKTTAPPPSASQTPDETTPAATTAPSTDGAPQGATATYGIQLGVRDGQLVPGGDVPNGADVVTVDVISDFICPICGTFEQLQGEGLREKALAGEIILIEHPLGYLDGYSTTEYSSRAANAAVLVAQQDPEHYLAFTEQLWANQPDEGGAGLSDEEIAALAQQAGVDQGVVDQMPDRPLADWVVASTQYAMQEEGFGGTPRVRMALGDGELMAWQTWYQAYQDDSGQTMVYPGDLDLALANVQAGRSPDDAGGTTNSEDVPDPSLAEGREWTGTIKVADLGDITITLDGVNAPQAVANFVTLAKAGYYDNHSCHRLTTEGIWVVQCGSLTGDGTDTPGYTFGPLENVPSDDVYPRGTIAMARAQAQDSQGAQFFIVYQDSTISGGYTVFGHVTEGMDLIDQVAAAGVDPSSGSESDGPLLLPMLIESITVQ